jgi:cobalt/nickel transport system permease protein
MATQIAPPIAPPRPVAKTKRQKPSFVEKTIAGISHNIEQAVFSEENARRPGLLQRRDPRAKLVAFVLLVVAAGLSRSLPVLAALYALVLVLAALSKLDVCSYVTRVWLGIPLFSGIVILPSIFFVGKHVLVHIPLGFFTLEIHREGIAAAIVFIVRVGVSVSLAVLLILTTRWADILKSLRAFHVPAVFVVVLSMTYRYIFLVLHTTNAMFEARKSRVVARTGGREQRGWVVATMGTLISRSLRMSEEVYQAMLARGFTGAIYTYDTYQMRAADWLLLLAALLAAAAAIVFSRRTL